MVDLACWLSQSPGVPDVPGGSSFRRRLPSSCERYDGTLVVVVVVRGIRAEQDVPSSAAHTHQGRTCKPSTNESHGPTCIATTARTQSACCLCRASRSGR